MAETVDLYAGHLVCEKVEQEVMRAIELHDGMRNAHEAYAVILEELDEVWDLVKANPKKMTDEQRATYREEMRKELIQVAAMCVRTIVDLRL